MTPRRMLRPLLALLLTAAPALALDDPRAPLEDPYRTGMLSYHQIRLLGDPERIALDPRVVVRAPDYAEDSLHVPVLIDASAVENVKRIVAFVDYGPIPKILEYRPGRALPKIAFRFKIDQSTPVRAAVELEDGSWLMGGAEIDAMGGGCTVPAAAYASDDWEERLGEVRALLWPGEGRLALRVDHPMDTGLVDGIPVFIIEHIAVSDQSGDELARVTLFEPVEEDPNFRLFLRPADAGAPLRISGRDNNGNDFAATVAPSGLTQ
jgi:sulfur-oxidizing protein SoxY